MARLATVRESRARFVEEKTLAALDRPLRSEGWLLYRRPAFFEKTTTAPIQESVMVDGDRLSLVSAGQPPRLLDLGAEPGLHALVDAVRGTLAGDLATLRRSYRVTFEGDPSGWRLTLVPLGEPLARLLREVVVAGTGTNLGEVRFLQANGDRSVMTIRPGP